VGTLLTRRATRRDARTVNARIQGGVDKGEKPLAAARRELFEETGVRSAELLGEARARARKTAHQKLPTSHPARMTRLRPAGARLALLPVP
jgi:8-oxo-dGTP pyrophosphatase MutT (NUDIX family)